MNDLNGPNVKIKPPGSKSKELLELKEKYVAKGVSVAFPIVVDKAHGVYVQDVDGNVYIDFAGGIGVLNAGHTPDEVVEAIITELTEFGAFAQTYVFYGFSIRAIFEISRKDA